MIEDNGCPCAVSLGQTPDDATRPKPSDTSRRETAGYEFESRRQLSDQCGGTDLHLHEGQFMATYPLTPGHETVGVVDQLGEGVTGFALSQQVTINPNTSCGLCDYCRAGRPILCDQLTGMGSNRPGAFAEYVVAPVGQVFDAEGLAIDTAVFAEPRGRWQPRSWQSARNHALRAGAVPAASSR